MLNANNGNYIFALNNRILLDIRTENNDNVIPMLLHKRICQMSVLEHILAQSPVVQGMISLIT